jgi:DNA-binding transcriptional ArsR family regulator
MNMASSTTGSISHRREAGSGWDTVSVTTLLGSHKMFDANRTVRQMSNSSQVCPMLERVMDDVAEPAVDDMLLPKVLAALADPHRLASVRFLARNGESWCAQVMQEAGLELTKSTFSHHLRILREAGLVTKRIQGARGYARLRKEDVDRRFPGLLDSIINADEPARV